MSVVSGSSLKELINWYKIDTSQEKRSAETEQKPVQERRETSTRMERNKYWNEGKEVLKLPPSSTGKKKDIYMKREREAQQSAE